MMRAKKTNTLDAVITQLIIWNGCKGKENPVSLTLGISFIKLYESKNMT